jgi:hypothetical protein
MDLKLIRVNPMKRLAYTFVGLVAGDAMLLLYLVQNALRERAWLVSVHMGEPQRQIPIALDSFVIYAMFSFAGWLLVGLPTALIFPAHFITRLSWPLALILGAVLGPLALVGIFLLHDHVHIYLSSSFAETVAPYALAVLVSSVSFVVYRVLLSKERAS